MVISFFFGGGGERGFQGKNVHYPIFNYLGSDTKMAEWERAKNKIN